MTNADIAIALSIYLVLYCLLIGGIVVVRKVTRGNRRGGACAKN